MSAITVPVTYKLPLDLSFSRLAPGSLRSTFEVTVSQEDVARWLRIHEDDCDWYTRASPWGGPIAPPYILYYASQNVLAAAPELPSASGYQAGSGSLARYRAEFVAPILAGEPITLRCQILDRFIRRGRGYVEWETVASQGAQVVQRHWKSWAVSVSPAELAAGPEKPSEPRGSDDAPDLERFGPLALAITRERLEDFEGPNHPNDTTHTNVDLARAAGFPNVRAQGELPFGLLARLMRDRFGERFVAGGTLDVRLLNTVYAGESLIAHGAVVGKADDRQSCRLWTESSSGALVAAGSASVRTK